MATNAPPDEINRPAWFTGTAAAVALLLLYSWAEEREHRHRAEMAEVQRWGVSIRKCPRPAPGMTQTVVLVVHSTADDKPTVSGCARIADRSIAAGSGAPK